MDRRRSLSDIGRHVECGRNVLLDVGDGHIEYRVASISLPDTGWEFNASEIFVISEDGFEHIVAEDGVVEPRRDHLDKILVVQQAFEPGLIGGGKGDYRFFCSSHSFCPCSRPIGHCRFDETVRRHPDLREPAVNRGSQVTFGRRWHSILAGDVPRVVTVQNPDLTQFANQRLKTAAAGRIFGLLAPPIVAHGRNGVVDGHGVVGQVEPRPGIVAVVCLAEHEVASPAGEFDRSEISSAQRRLCSIECRLRILGRQSDST